VNDQERQVQTQSWTCLVLEACESWPARHLDCRQWGHLGTWGSGLCLMLDLSFEVLGLVLTEHLAERPGDLDELLVS